MSECQNRPILPLCTELVVDVSTYDHTHWNILGLVCSPYDKPVKGRLVVGSVTTSEHRLLYVFLAEILSRLAFMDRAG